MSVTIHPFMRPDDADAFRQALRRVRQDTGVPLAFGGQVTDRVLCLSEFLGARTNALRGLNVMPGTGLGGYVVAHRRPLEINDYSRAKTITHDYDDPVLAEGIRSITAAPVTVRGTVRGVLYAGVRSVFPLGNRTTSALLEISRQLAGEIAIRDEVDRRIQLLEAAASSPPAVPEASRSREELRDLYTEFRSIALQLQDTELRGRLLRACDRFARVGVNSPHSAAVVQPSLSPRELDVLSHAALGCTNAEIAERLSLLPETVKAYLRNATRKLGVHGRNQAVAAARRQGLLPLRASLSRPRGPGPPRHRRQTASMEHRCRPGNSDGASMSLKIRAARAPAHHEPLPSRRQRRPGYGGREWGGFRAVMRRDLF